MDKEKSVNDLLNTMPSISGMMIESMAGKAGALHGLYLDSTPFTFSEDQPAVDYFGQMLTAGKRLGGEGGSLRTGCYNRDKLESRVVKHGYCELRRSWNGPAFEDSY